MTEKTHYRKAFNSPYLSSADIVEPTILTIKHVILESDKSNKSKDQFNTAYFAEQQIRLGEPLKPMILNVGNSKTIKRLTGSPYINDWNNIKVTVYVDPNVKFGRETIEGLRISPDAPTQQVRKKIEQNTQNWTNAVAAYIRDGNLDAVKKRIDISDEDAKMIEEQAKAGLSNVS